jgi:hypothetical protein
MPIYPKLILKLVEESGVGFSNAKTNEEIKGKISQYGYDDARLDELLALNARTVEKLQAFESLSGEQLDATRKLNELYESEYNQYSVFRQIANKLFVGEEYKGLRSQLGIDVDIKTNFEGVIEQAKQFYEGAMKNQDRLQGVLKISLTNERIQERLNAFSVLKNFNDAQESAKGKAKAAHNNFFLVDYNRELFLRDFIVYYLKREESYLKKLKKIKDGLMEDLLTGKVRVKGQRIKKNTWWKHRLWTNWNNWGGKPCATAVCLKHPNPPSGKISTMWHTQGSGKSYTMVFLIRKMRHIQGLKDYKILMVNDRIELEKQLGDTAALTGEKVKHITSTRSLKKKLASAKSDVSLVMLHKFAERQTDKHSLWLYQRVASRKPIYGKELDTDDILDNVKILDEVNPSEKILIMVDEAHRSQGNILNPSLFNAFPNAAKIAFTGTPLITERHDRKTVDIFGYYIDIYNLKDSVKDKNTIPIMCIGSTADAAIRGKELMDRKFEDLFRDRTDQELSRIRKKYGTLGTILEAKNYIAQIAEHLVNHYVNEILVNGFKAQVVTHSQMAAVRYKDAIDKALYQRLEFEKSKPIPNLPVLRRLEIVKTAVMKVKTKTLLLPVFAVKLNAWMQ